MRPSSLKQRAWYILAARSPCVAFPFLLAQPTACRGRLHARHHRGFAAGFDTGFKSTIPRQIHTYRPPVAAYSRGFAPLAKKLSILRDPSSSAVGARPRWTLPACAVVTVASSDGAGSRAATSEGVLSASDAACCCRSTRFGRRLRPGSWKAHSLGRLQSRVSSWKLLATMQGTHTGRPAGIALRAATPPFAIEGGMPQPSPCSEVPRPPP